MRGYDDAAEPIRQGLDLGELDEDEVKSIIQRELENALGNNDGDLARQRQEALKYYDGEKFGNEVDGRSEVVMRSVLEAVEWVLPALLRIFTASDQICLIEPNLPGSEDKAKRATQYINWIFYRDNPGFMILHDWFKDALLEKVGWVKYWWDTQEETETKSYEGLTREQYDALLGQDADVEVVKESKYTQEVDSFLQDRPQPPPPLQPPPLPGMPPIPVPPLELYDCTLRITRDNGRARIEGVPPEQIRFSPRARRGDIPFISHVVQWTYSDLLEQGYDADTLDEVPFDDTMDWNTERRERYGKEAYTLSDERSDSAREIWVEESYIQLALGKSKTTELYKVTTAGAGKVILTKGGKPDIECVEEAPFVSICPIPRPHALVGNSLADLTMDIQLIKSTLMRQMLDNAYLSNWPRMEIGDDVVNENTYDDMLTHRPGGMVRTRRLGGIQALAVPYTADKTFGLIEYLDQTQEVRTGVARHNQGINPDDLNKTATGVSLLQQAAAQRVELFARIFAVGVQELLRGVMGLVKRHQQQERIIHITGDWLKFSPDELRGDDMPVTVSVGLGTGNRDQILAQLMQLVQLQGNIVMQQGGVQGPLVYAKNVYDVLHTLTEAAGFKQPFFQDPSVPPPPGMAGPPQPPKPDPTQAVVEATKIKAQATVQAMGLKAQAQQQQAQSKAQLDSQLAQQRAQLDAELQQRRLDHELEMERQQAQHKMVLEAQQAQHEQELQTREMLAKVAVAQREVELKAEAGAYNPRPAPNGSNGAGG